MKTDFHIMVQGQYAGHHYQVEYLGPYHYNCLYKGQRYAGTSINMAKRAAGIPC